MDSIKAKWCGGELASTILSPVNAIKPENQSSLNGLLHMFKKFKTNLMLGTLDEYEGL